MDTYVEKIQEAVSYIAGKTENKPQIGLILGSGLGELADHIQGVTIPYSEIPHFPKSTVAGHKGQLVAGEYQGKQVIAMQGRFHYYEGYSLQQTTFPVRVMKQLGVEVLVVTNAAGGVNTNFQPGDLMVIDDHINLTGQNPLIGDNLQEFGERFSDMSNAYTRELRSLLKTLAARENILLREGVYAGMTGPSYETPAEIRMLRTIGADAIGMSTVPEVIVASHCRMKVLGISCISNMAAGILPQPLYHTEVMETAERVKMTFMHLVKQFIKEL